MTQLVGNTEGYGEEWPSAKSAAVQKCATHSLALRAGIEKWMLIFV
jgi:hypothetical protein